MAELGQTRDPRALVPGDPTALRGTSAALAGFAKGLTRVGEGLRGIDDGGWTGEAADRFREFFDGEPGRWITCGESFTSAENAVDRYVEVLAHAQEEAGAAIELWDRGEQRTRAARDAYERAARDGDPGEFVDPGAEDRAAARRRLDSGRAAVREAGDTAASVVARAQEAAPEERNLFEEAFDAVGDIVGGAVRETGELLGDAIEAVGDFADEALDKVGDLGRTVVEGATGGIAAVLDGLGDVTGIQALGDAGDAVEAAGEDAGDAFDDTMDEAGEDADEATEDAADAVEEGTDDAADTVDGGEDDTPGPESTDSQWDGVEGAPPDREDIGVSDTRRAHILDGDGDGVGGGHAAGTGLPNKKEFPESWDDDQIIDNAEDVARNPDSPPVQQDNGRWRTTGTRDGVTMTVIVNPDGSIHTAYPEGGDGVIQNDADGNPK